MSSDIDMALTFVHTAETYDNTVKPLLSATASRGYKLNREPTAAASVLKFFRGVDSAMGDSAVGVCVTVAVGAVMRDASGRMINTSCLDLFWFAAQPTKVFAVAFDADTPGAVGVLHMPPQK